MRHMLTIWRRRIIAGVIVLVCCITAFVEAVSAARHALLPVVGPVGSRLILVAFFAAIAGLCVWLVMRREAADAAAEPSPAEAAARAEASRIALLAEAIQVGLSLGRGLRDGLSGRNNASKPEPPSAEPAASDPTPGVAPVSGPPI